jgi:hypothetical protein
MRAFVILMMLAGAARAGTITPPAGWTSDPETAVRLDKHLDHFGGLPTQATFEVYRPATAGAVLYVTFAQAAVAAAKRDAAASAELEELRAEVKRHGGDAKVESSSQAVDPAKQQIEGVLRWRDAAMGLVVSTRIVMAADAQRVLAVRGECMLAADAPAALVKACEDALATLDVGLATGRVALAITATEAPAATAAEPPASGSNGPPAARLDDGSRAVLPPIPVAPKARETDRRPIYVGGGLIVLAAAFWWNRRRREKFERDEKQERGVPADDDGDGEDLHEAAADAPPEAEATDGKDKHDG